MALRPYLVTLVERPGKAEITDSWTSSRFVMAKGPRDAIDRLPRNDIAPWPDRYATVEVLSLERGMRLGTCRARRFVLYFDRVVYHVEEVTT